MVSSINLIERTLSQIPPKNKTGKHSFGIATGDTNVRPIEHVAMKGEGEKREGAVDFGLIEHANEIDISNIEADKFLRMTQMAEMRETKPKLKPQNPNPSQT